MRLFLNLKPIFAVFFALATSNLLAVQHAFLVQNSGWMEPFYVDTTSQFKPLISAIVGATAKPEDTVFTMAFSQSSGENASPVVLFEGRGGLDVTPKIASLQIAKKGSSQALADTDFQEAISKTIAGPFKSTPGILWIFTNNKNSPNNDAKTAERNKDFYRLLHLEPSITKTLVFPLKMPVKGKLYSATGLMVYALAYGESAAEELDRIMAEGRLSRILTNAPARLKPVDQEAVRIVPIAVKNAPNVKASLGNDKRTLILDVEAEKFLPTITLQASLQNLFYPYVIRSATVASMLTTGGEEFPINVSPSTVDRLLPGGTQPIEVQFTLPMAQIPSAWSPQAIAAMGKQVVLPMVVEIGLTGQQLVLSDDFVTDLKSLFPGDPISEIFIPPDSVRSSSARVPMLVRIQYPLTPVVVCMTLLLLILAAIAGLMTMSGRSKRFEVRADDMRKQVVMKPFSRMVIRNAEGEPVGEVKRGFGTPKVLSVVEGRSLKFTGR